MTMTIDARVEAWKQQLLDLSNANSLLSMSRATTRATTLRLIAPAAAEIYAHLINEEKPGQPGKLLTIVGTEPPAPTGGTTNFRTRPTAGQRELPSCVVRGGLPIEAALPKAITSEPIEVAFRVLSMTPMNPVSRTAITSNESVSSTADAAKSADTDLEFIPIGTSGSVVSGEPPAPMVIPTALAHGTARVELLPDHADRVGQTLWTKARSSEQEQGINTLFAAFGTLKWRESATDTGRFRWRYAPLLLVPIRIEASIRNGRNRITATGDDPEFNQALVERLRRNFNITISIESVGESEGENDRLGNVLRAVRDAIMPMAEWEVLDEVTIGIFHFHRLRMFRDLDEHRSIASAHPIIQALADPDRVPEGMSKGMSAHDTDALEDLDRTIGPKQSFAILDADASQLWAIQAAVRGSNLVVQGPPGTGKSQTIANMIAECLAAGKTVLFVSEKATALDVVYRRLERKNLAEFCLRLHSHKASKRDIVQDLARRLDPLEIEGNERQEDEDLDRLGAVRGRLRVRFFTRSDGSPSSSRSAHSPGW